jgi:hypothetical protein
LTALNLACPVELAAPFHHRRNSEYFRHLGNVL